MFGVWAPGEEVAKLTYFGLYALQHRGQESAGIAVSDGNRTLVMKEMGLVSQVFEEPDLNSLKGYLAVGHCRYSTTGASVWMNAQPTFRPTASPRIEGGPVLPPRFGRLGCADLRCGLSVPPLAPAAIARELRAEEGSQVLCRAPELTGGAGAPVPVEGEVSHGRGSRGSPRRGPRA